MQPSEATFDAPSQVTAQYRNSFCKTLRDQSQAQPYPKQNMGNLLQGNRLFSRAVLTITFTHSLENHVVLSLFRKSILTASD